MKPTRSRRKCAKYLSVEAHMLLETLGHDSRPELHLPIYLHLNRAIKNTTST